MTCESEAEPAVQNGNSGRRATAFRWLLGVALLAALLATVGLDGLARTVRQASPLWLGPLAIFAAIWIGLGGLNVWILLRRLAKLPFPVFLRVYVTSWATAMILPGQLGDATQILFLRRYGVGTERSSAAYVVDKVISFAWLVGIGALGLILYVPTFELEVWLLLLPLVSILTVALLWRLARAVPSRRGTWREKFGRWWENLLSHVRIFLRFPATLALNVAVTILKWLAMAGIYWTAFRAFGAEVPFSQASVIPVMSSLVGYIPITVGGAGTMEWTAVVLFQGLGVAAAEVVSAFLLQRVVIFCLVLFLLVALGRRSKSGPRRRAREHPADGPGTSAGDLSGNRPSGSTGRSVGMR